MRLLFTALAFLIFGQLWSQPSGKYVRTIEKLRSKGKLKTKASSDKTSVGSVVGYYDNNSLVLINSLTDAEAAGTETLYYIKNGVLKKVFIMKATFDSNVEWKEYYSKHKSVDNCYACHGKENCIVTEITLGDNVIITLTENGKMSQLTQVEKERILKNVRGTSEELKILLKEFE